MFPPWRKDFLTTGASPATNCNRSQSWLPINKPKKNSMAQAQVQRNSHKKMQEWCAQIIKTATKPTLAEKKCIRSHKNHPRMRVLLLQGPFRHHQQRDKPTTRCWRQLTHSEWFADATSVRALDCKHTAIDINPSKHYPIHLQPIAYLQNATKHPQQITKGKVPKPFIKITSGSIASNNPSTTHRYHTHNSRRRRTCVACALL
jgi:hypothetical protein